MFAKWLDEYQKLAGETRFLSKVGTFLVSLFAFLSCWRLIEAISYNPSAINTLWNNIWVSIICHLTVGIVFAIRFGSLFFNSKRSFWLAQTFWIISILTLFGYFTITRLTLYGGFFRPEAAISFGMHDYPKIFLYADYTFEVFACLYFIASLIRQVTTAFVACNKTK